MTRIRSSAARRWRMWIAAYVLLALAWPSIGPLPWLVDFGAAIAHDDADAHHHPRASDIPGSPTHPSDHDCFQCEVIKHLVRCVPADICEPVVALVAGAPPQPAIELASFDPGFQSTRPPIRAPPPPVV